MLQSFLMTLNPPVHPHHTVLAASIVLSKLVVAELPPCRHPSCPVILSLHVTAQEDRTPKGTTICQCVYRANYGSHHLLPLAICFTNQLQGKNTQTQRELHIIQPLWLKLSIDILVLQRTLLIGCLGTLHSSWCSKMRPRFIYMAVHRLRTSQSDSFFF